MSLKQNKRPLHFRDIGKHIQELPITRVSLSPDHLPAACGDWQGAGRSENQSAEVILSRTVVQINPASSLRQTKVAQSIHTTQGRIWKCARMWNEKVGYRKWEIMPQPGDNGLIPSFGAPTHLPG